MVRPQFIRECTVTVKPGQLFGFDVATNTNRDNARLPGPYILAVEPSSPASRAGLLPDDYVVKVGDQVVTNMAHKDIVALIKACGNTVTLTVESAALDIMKQRKPFIKVVGKRVTRQLWLSDDCTKVCWVSKHKSKHDSVYRIGDIKEIRVGRATTAFQRSYDYASQNDKEVLGGANAYNCFSIIHGEDFESVDLVAPDEIVYNAWVNGLQFLVLKPVLGAVADENLSARDAWLREIFEQSDVNGDNELSLSEVRMMMKRLNLNISNSLLKRKFYEADQNKGKKEEGHNKLDFNEFKVFYKSLATRPEVAEIMIKYGSATKDRRLRAKDPLDTFDDLTMDARQLSEFMLREQSSNATQEQCEEFIRQCEPSKELAESGVMGIDGFMRYLLSEEGDAYNPNHKVEVYQDMNQPLTHYFISSSHNTYLMEDQLRGPSDVEAYIRALLLGCRCVELDCWDGDDGEPIIFHGHTLTSKISFDDVVKACKEYGFATSKYPLILSLENHCSLDQQQKMAASLKKHFGDAIHAGDPDTSLAEFPSPEDLKGKVLIKGKKLPPSSDEVSDEDEAEDALMDENTLKNQPKQLKKNLKLNKDGTVKKKHKVHRELSDLISLVQSVHFKGFKTPANELPYYQMSSFGENKARELATHPDKGKLFCERNKRQLARTYPAGFRVTSSNYEPHEMWNAGCQIVALNYQTHCHEMNMNQGKFRDNGGCGYVLKPLAMRQFGSGFDPNDPSTLDPSLARLVSIRIISAQHLPKPDRAKKGEIVDPFVRVEVFGLPLDCQKLRTKTIDNNGFNPRWDQLMEFDIHYPENALVYIKIADDDFFSGDDFLAQAVIPIRSLRPGYRHIRLRAKNELPLTNSTLFIHVSISDIGRSKLARRQSGALVDNHALDVYRPIKIRELDEMIEQSATDVVQELQESFLVSTERFRESLGLELTASINNGMHLLRTRVEALGGKLDLESVNAAGSDCYRLVEMGLSREKVSDSSIDRPLRNYESMRNGAESILKSHDANRQSIKNCLARLEEIFHNREEFTQLCLQNKIKGDKSMKETQKRLEKKILFLREKLLLNETIKSNAISLMNTVRQVISNPGPADNPAGVLL